MKSGGPLKRTGPLQRKTPLRSTGRFSSGRGSTMRAPRANRPVQVKRDADADVWNDVRLIIYVRAGGRCELCDRQLNVANMEGHHRRSRGVKARCRHCPCNALALCHDCHHGKPVHGNVDGTARENGLILSKLSDQHPSTVPALLHRGLVRLTCGGTYDQVA